jgi:ribosomal protein S18 acetylase RimI-like enzyme
MLIRPFREDDEEAVIALWNEVFPDAPPWNDPKSDIGRKLTIQRDLFLVAEMDEELVGTAMAGFDGHRGWVYYLAVSPPHRRRGIGATLMARVEEGLARLGCGKLNLQVRGSNRDAVAFYEKLGYEIEDRISMGKRFGSC